MLKTIRINRVHYPVTVLGPGRRIGIWLQGCTMGCPGCLAKDTWRADAGSAIAIVDLIDCCRRFEAKGVDGITISGGEPFEQPVALASLLKGLHEWTDRLEQTIDYLCYTGKSFDVLRQEHPDILSLLDTIIPEPFISELPGRPLRGSGNQPIIPLTELGISRFAEYFIESSSICKKLLQLTVDGNSAWFIGIPGRGDMEKLSDICKSRGLLLKDASW